MCEAQLLMVNTYIHKDTGMLLKLIKNWFNQPTYASDLEAYIVSHNPTSVYQVEALAREYDKKLFERTWIV